MANSTRIVIIFNIFNIFMIATTQRILADSECPDDNNTILRDPTGCPTGNIPVVMRLFPPYVMWKDNGGIEISPSGIVFDYISATFSGCCYGNGNDNDDFSLVLQNDQETDIEAEEFYDALMNSDIIFPVTEKLETILTLSGVSYTFHDIVKVHGFVLVGFVDQYNAKARGLVLDSLFDSWPIFVLTILLAGIAGIFIWALEFHVKNEEFSMSFTRGSYEGFWWAFISMTTVGYGDKTPRSFFGRLFGVLWILLGLVVTTMFVATVTSALTHSSSPEFINGLEGLKVAVFEDSNADAEATYLGAIPHLYTEFEDMHNALLNEEVEGVFMERLQAYYFYKDKDLYNDDNLRVFHTVPTEISYKMALKQSTTCKLLEKNYCFRRRLENPLIDSLVKKYTAPLKAFKPSVDTVGILSGHSRETSIFLLSIMGVFFGLSALGISIELFLRKSAKRFSKPVPFHMRGQREASDVNAFQLNAVLKQLKGFEENLENLSTQVQTMKQNLTSVTFKGTTDESLKLEEFN